MLVHDVAYWVFDSSDYVRSDVRSHSGFVSSNRRWHAFAAHRGRGHGDESHNGASEKTEIHRLDKHGRVCRRGCCSWIAAVIAKRGGQQERPQGNPKSTAQTEHT